MKFFLRIFFILIVTAGSAAAEPIRFELKDETIEIQTERGRWIRGFEHHAGSKGVVEYILPGEETGNWTQKVTINYFQGMTEAGKVEKLAAFTQSGLTQICKDTQWSVLSKKDQGIVYKWSVKNCKDAPDQSEIARIFQSKEGLYVLHYAHKEVPMPEKEYSAWLNLLNNAVIKKNS